MTGTSSGSAAQDPPKNLPALLAAFQAIERQLDVRLVIAGEGPQVDLTAAGVDGGSLDRVTVLGPVSEAEKIALLNRASVLVSPSLYEGFGFAPMEAMARGCPVVTSHAGGQPEVCGDAAVYVDPKQPRQIADALRHVLTHPDLARHLVERGRARTGTFTWEASVRAHLAVFDLVARLDHMGRSAPATTCDGRIEADVPPVKPLSKLCDATDWFEPEFNRIIRSELEEEPRFHRKQWEFAQIFRTLHSLGYLNARSAGLSMGGGEERLLYAVARHVGHLTVTDLYDSSSVWDGARTDNPDRSLNAAPFAIDASRLTARRMDMRSLEFDDATFDFCYSSCAIERIGKDDDFLKHLREVRRVLKDDGVYVLTTEFHYGEDVIRVPRNYYFSSGFLHELVREASFATFNGVDSAVWPHPLNRPLPARLSDLFPDPADSMTGALLRSVPHVQLLTGGLPFSSASLVLTKPAPGVATGVLPISDLAASRQFIEEGVRHWKAFVEGAELRLDPFGLLTTAALQEGFPDMWRGMENMRCSIAATCGWAVQRAAVTVSLEAWPADNGSAVIEFRVQQRPTHQPDDVTCLGSIAVGNRQP